MRGGWYCRRWGTRAPIWRTSSWPCCRPCRCDTGLLCVGVDAARLAESLCDWARRVCNGVPRCVRGYLVCGEREGVGVDVRRLRWMCGASASVQGSGGSASAVSGRECRRCAADVFEWVPAHRLPLSSLPLLRLGLPRRPQRCADWARDEGGEVPGCTTLPD